MYKVSSSFKRSVLRFFIILLLLQPLNLNSMVIVLEKITETAVAPALIGLLQHLWSNKTDVNDLLSNKALNQIKTEDVEAASSVNLAKAYSAYCNELKDAAINRAVSLSPVERSLNTLPDFKPCVEVPAHEISNHIKTKTTACKIAFDTYSEAELNEMRLRYSILSKLAAQKAQDPITKNINDLLLKEKNEKILCSYESIYKRLIKICDDSDSTAFERAKYIFELRQEIPKIEDVLVRNRFQKTFKQVLFKCCDTDGSIDLMVDTKNAKCCVHKCFKELCENSQIKNRLLNQERKFIFSNYVSGLSESKKISRRMKQACTNSECINEEEEIDLSKFDRNFFNLKLKKIVDLVDKGDFDQAIQNLNSINSHGNKLSSAQKVINSVYPKIYNQYGILREFENDPLWKNLPDPDKQRVKHNHKLARLLNIGFLNKKLNSQTQTNSNEVEETIETVQEENGCIPHIKQETIPCGSSKIKTEIQALDSTSCVENHEQISIDTCSGENKPNSNLIEERFGNSEDSDQGENPEKEMPQCNSSKQRNLPNLRDEIFEIAQSESDEQDSEETIYPAIAAASQEDDDDQAIKEHLKKILNDIEHNPELKAKIEDLKEVVEEFNNSEEAKNLSIWIDAEKFLYHVLHGNCSKGRITGKHFKDFDCCFEFVTEHCNSEGVCFGKVRMKNSKWQKYIKEKPSTTVFPADWDFERILYEIRNAIKKDKIIRDEALPNNKDRVLILDISKKIKIECLISLKTGRINSAYSKIIR